MTDLILLCVSLLIWGIGEGMFFIFQPIYLQQLGADTMTIAGIFSAFGVAMMAVQIPAGYLADRIGRKPLLVAAWAAGLLAAWTMALARSLLVFVAGVLLYGLTAFVSSPMNSYVTAARGRLSTARAMTLVSAAFNLGAVIGPFSGGWLGQRFGLQAVFLAAACLFIPSTGLLLFLRNQPREVHDPATPPGKLLANRRFIGLLGIGMLATFVMYLPQPLTPRFLSNERGLSLASIGLLGSVGGLGNTVLNLVLGQFAARTGFLLAEVSVAAFALLLWQGTGLPWYALGYFLLGGYRAGRALISAQIRPLIHSVQMGLAYGMAETLNSLAVVLAPLLAGAVYTRGPLLIYPLSMGLLGLVLAISAFSLPRESSGEKIPVISLPPES
jgi:MFS family permease